MAVVIGMTLVKQFTYRGDPLEEFSNTYWFTFSSPADSTAWKALADALAAQEKTIYPNDVRVIRAYGYDSDSDDAVAVWSWDYLALATPIVGTFAVGAGIRQPGDAAVWLRWSTDHLNSKGRRIYLRKYFHPAFSAGGAVANCDTVFANQRTALEAFGTKLIDGTFLDGRTVRPRKYGAVVSSPASSAYITTRTLKRRGKRPNS